ncbi:UDP-N-acetylmuramoyl-L-alanyl-D-glutamate--2,6-diaminopimelate ligase [Propionibacterium sp.]|uniref:UDP-N-acetylmuramoyl-L-alanyl-D-glutamate--2, 6-diaminopimelate ligase n=1 Tax=Propionibacterium sp. TaxID=1977903 RepID=UPI0039E7CC64
MTTSDNTPASTIRALRPHLPGRVPLSELGAGLDLQIPAGAADLGIIDIELDSRAAGDGSLYVGLPGTRTHGARFAGQAAAQGAVAVLTDPEGARLAEGQGIPVVVAADPRHAMALLAARLFGEPAQHLLMLGLTGTNGKTTTAFLVEAALAAAGLHVGTIGTNGFRLDARTLPSSRTTITTPESSDLQALLAVMRQGGAAAVVMEASSVALYQERVDGVYFDVAGFTNLGRDHLDFHKTQEAYFEAKAKLFTAAMCRRAVINADDPWGRILVERARSAGAPEVVTTGFDAGRDYRVLSFEPNEQGGEHIELDAAGRRLGIDIALPGRYNVANAATCVAMIDQAGIDLDQAVPGMAHAQVPGRMQRVHLGPGAPRVYVDFAHTPQAVESALSALHGRTIVVLGAGGDRDKAKRVPMGDIAAEHADVVVVTDDNPRSEDPAAIRAELLRGAAGHPGVEVLDGGDRSHAIGMALRLAGPDDALAVLGKGHETTQEIEGVRHPFDDVAEVTRQWAQLHSEPKGH